MYDGTTLSAPAFEIRWRSDDVRGPGAVPPATESTESLSASTQNTGPVPSSPTSDSQVQDTGVSEGSRNIKTDSPGRIAGIVTGSLLGCCLLLVGTYIFWRRRRRNLAKMSGSFGATTDSEPMRQRQDSVAELHDNAVGPRELSADSQHSNRVRPSHISPVELPAS
jgi:hypothetical protein